MNARGTQTLAEASYFAADFEVLLLSWAALRQHPRISKCT